jgi:hypothetical protein
MQAFSLVDNKRFRDLLNLCDPRWVVPERHTISYRLRDSFDLQYERIKNMLAALSCKVNVLCNKQILEIEILDILTRHVKKIA